MTEPKHGTFVVTHADQESAILEDVADGQVHAVTSNPDLAAGDVVEATLTPEQETDVTWDVEISGRRTIHVNAVDEDPSERAVELADGQDEGDHLARTTIDDGELHVLTVPEGVTAQAVSDVVEDEQTRRRAARLGASQVEVRAAAGVLGIRYLRAEEDD